LNAEEIRRYLAGDATLDLRGSEDGAHAGLEAYASLASSRGLLLDDVLRWVLDGRMTSVVAMPKVDRRADSLSGPELRVASDQAATHSRAAEDNGDDEMVHVWHGIRLGLEIAAGRATIRDLVAAEESRKSVERINWLKSTR